ncbi:hypothetical protein OAQ99_02515 [Candidatus Kapabacteria bacterium]|nr:hypothetical protein [Candidatus Kapabacteria bacterium]
MKIAYYLFILSLIFISSCIKLDDPMAPSWDTKLNIPIKDTIYFLEDQIKTDQYIKVDSSSNTLIYKVSSDVYREVFSVNEYVKGQIDGNYSGYDVPFVTGKDQLGIEFSSGAKIDSAWIKSGQITINIINNTPNIADNVIITAIGILDENGDPIQLSTNIDANSTKSLERDLANYTYTSRFQENSNELVLDVELTTQATSAEQMQIEIIITNSDFYYIDGTLVETEIKSIRETISLPITSDVEDFRNKITFTDAKMDIKAIYQSDETPLFPALFKDITLSASTLDGDFEELKKIDGSKLDDQLVEDGSFIKQYNTTEHTLSDLFSIVPDSVILESVIIMNPSIAASNRGIARDTDSIIVEYLIEAKAEMVIDTVVINTEEEFDIGDEDISDIELARLRYQLKSELPAEVDINFSFLDVNKDTLFTKTKKLQGSNVTSDNYTVEPIDIDDEIVFNENEIDLLNQAEFVDLNIFIYTNQENFTAWFGPKLSIDILSWAEIDFFIDNNNE